MGARTVHQSPPARPPTATVLSSPLPQVLPSKGAQHMGRGRQLLQAFQSPNRQAAAAATAASNAAGGCVGGSQWAAKVGV